MDNKRKETEILKKEISELRERMLGGNQQIEPSDLPKSTIGYKLGTIGKRFTGLMRYKQL